MKYLAIGPGGMGYFALLGTISKFKQAGQLANLAEISGASAGGLLALVFALTRGDTTKALDYSLTIPVKTLMKPNLRSLIKDYGLVSSSKLRKTFSEMIKNFTGRDEMTFAELYEWFPIKIHLSSYCVNSMKTVYFSVDSTPSMSVIDAVSATIAIPFIISPVKLNDGWNYVDGGSAEATPCGPFLGRDSQDIVTLAFDWKFTPEIKDLKSYAFAILTSTMRLRPTYSTPTIMIDVGNLNLFDFSADQEAKLRMFLVGFSQ